MSLLGRKIKLISDPEPLVMPDELLDGFGDVYMTEVREISFEQFLRDRMSVLNCMLYCRRRDIQKRPPVVEALPV